MSTPEKNLIRPYRWEDKARLLEIWLAASLDAHAFLGRERLLAQQRVVGDVYLDRADTRVLERDGAPAAFIGLMDHFIGGLFVDPRTQGRGFGRALVENAIKDKGALDLEVYALNREALGFYSHLGFSEISRRPTDDEGLPFELILMRKSTE